MSKLIDLIEKPISGEWGEEDVEGNGVPVLRTTNFNNDGTVNYSNVVTRRINAIKLKEKFLRPGDIIIEKSGGSPKQPVGRVVFFEEAPNQYLFNNFTSVLRINNDNISPKYLFYQLFSKYNKGETRKYQNKTTGILNLKLDRFIKKIDITLPPLEVQRQIAQNLDTISELLALRKKQLEQLDELIKSVFYDMFGDPVTNDKGWEVLSVSSLCSNIFGGGTPSKSKPEYYLGDIPWVTPKDMKDLRIRDSIDHINDDAIKNSSTKLIPKGSILMVIRSGILKRTLPVAINDIEVTVNQDMKAFVLNDKVINEYLLYTFKALESTLLNRVRSVTADNIEFNLIKELNIPVPSLVLQNQFASIVTKIEEQKALVKQSIEETQLLFDSLMSQYFD